MWSKQYNQTASYTGTVSKQNSQKNVCSLQDLSRNIRYQNQNPKTALTCFIFFKIQPPQICLFKMINNIGRYLAKLTERKRRFKFNFKNQRRHITKPTKIFKRLKGHGKTTAYKLDHVEEMNAFLERYKL